jgi:hypothetical protein
MAEAKQKAQGNRVSKKLTQARQAESTTVALSGDVKTLVQWLNHDVLELAGPALVERQELYDFVVAELRLGLEARRFAPCARRYRISATISWGLPRCLMTNSPRSQRD